MTGTVRKVGIIGGSGISALFEPGDRTTHRLTTPWGPPSGPVEASGHVGSILGQDVSSADATLRLSAGQIDVTFAAVPASITATVTVGSVTLSVPGGVPYAVNATASVGSIQVRVTRSPASPHVITASTRTGSVTIQPAP